MPSITWRLLVWGNCPRELQLQVPWQTHHNVAISQCHNVTLAMSTLSSLFCISRLSPTPSTSSVLKFSQLIEGRFGGGSTQRTTGHFPLGRCLAYKVSRPLRCSTVLTFVVQIHPWKLVRNALSLDLVCTLTLYMELSSELVDLHTPENICLQSHLWVEFKFAKPSGSVQRKGWHFEEDFPLLCGCKLAQISIIRKIKRDKDKIFCDKYFSSVDHDITESVSPTWLNDNINKRPIFF